MTPPMTPREKVARIVDPAAFLFSTDELVKGDTSQYDALRKADAILTALASGSGDHAELARLRAHIENLKLRPGHHVRFGTPSVSQIDDYWNRELATDLEALLAEIAALRAERNAYRSAADLEAKSSDEAERKLAKAEAEVQRWKSAYDIAHEQATENGSAAGALRGKLAEAVGLLQEWMGTWFVDADSRGENAIADDTRKWLSKEAERG